MTKASSGERASKTPTSPEIVYLNNGSAMAILQWNEHIAAEAAMSHVVIRRALHKIASSVQQVGWIAAIDPLASAADQQNKEGVIRDINAFLSSPHDELAPDMMRYWMALNFALYSRIPIKVSFMATKPLVPLGIWPLEAKYVYAKYDKRGRVDKYEYGTSDTKQVFRSRQAAGRGQDFITQLWRPGLTGRQSRTDTNSPLNTIGLPAQVIKSLLIRAINTAEGHPNVRYLVTADGKLTDQQKVAIKTHLNDDHGLAGIEAGRIPILNNVAGFQIHTLDNDLSDIHSKMPMDDMSRLIFGAFDIPIALAGIGAADASKFAGNYDESRAAFWEDTIVPMYVSPIFGGLTEALCPPGVCIKPNYDKVPAMQMRRVANMKAVSGVEFLTTNEKRAMFGFEPSTELPAQTGRAIGQTGQTGANANE